MKTTKRIFVFFLFSVLTYSCLYAQQPAFPGAEGYGKYATGGRGGRAIEVTSLLDRDIYGSTLPGTFREALETPGNDPITIIFRVSGIIELKTNELKSKRSNMTIAGQTAPGDGICIKNGSIKLSGDSLIIRYIRFRPGDIRQTKVSGLNIENAKHVIVDHCSMSWAIEENATFYDNKYTTVQWCIISESLYDSYHDKGPRGYAGQWGGQYASYHHNLLAHNNSRSPRINGSRAHDTVALLDFRNNVIFNWRVSGAIYGGELEIYAEDPENPGENYARCHTNMVNNYYKPGPGTSAVHYFAAPSYVSEGDTAKGFGQWYFSGNYMEGVTGGMNDDNWLGVDVSDVWSADSIRSDEEFDVEPVATYTAWEAYDSVLTYAGAIRPKRDTIDNRIVAEVKGDIMVTGNGIIDSQTEIGGWPEYKTPPVDSVPIDTDHDGMPDEWEIKNGLNPDDAEDGKIITADGYSNLEHYLNSDIPYISTGTKYVSKHLPAYFRIYPNPASSHVFYYSDSKINRIEIFDALGQLVQYRYEPRLQGSIAIYHLACGLYIAKATFYNGQVYVNKFFKW